MTLQQYLTTTGQTRSAFAASISVTPEAVRLWLEGKRTPKPAMMRLIMDATGQAVTPNDFMPPQGTPS